jgi:hypothetical protein
MARKQHIEHFGVVDEGCFFQKQASSLQFMSNDFWAWQNHKLSRSAERLLRKAQWQKSCCDTA